MRKITANKKIKTKMFFKKMVLIFVHDQISDGVLPEVIQKKKNISKFGTVQFQSQRCHLLI